MRISACVILLVLIAHSGTGQSSHPALPPLEGITCSTCHTCEVPTKENPCVRECPRTRMLTVHHSPEEGPDYLVIRKTADSTDLYDPVNFSHRWHAEMSGMSGGCALCHHYNPPGGILPCRDCHEEVRSKASLRRPDLRGAYHQQCIQCHRAWSHEVSCRSCHLLRNVVKVETGEAGKARYTSRKHKPMKVPAKIVFDTPADVGARVTFYHDEHVNLFGLECAQCHSSETCIGCHDRQKTFQEVLKSTGAEHAACRQCHNVGDRCDVCHGSSEKSRFDHSERTGWSLALFHSALPCNRCHVKHGVFTGLDGTCLSCHGEWSPGRFKHSVTGVSLDPIHAELECGLCHVDMRFAKKPVCNNCHDNFTYPDRIPGRRVVRGTH